MAAPGVGIEAVCVGAPVGARVASAGFVAAPRVGAEVPGDGRSIPFLMCHLDGSQMS